MELSGKQCLVTGASSGLGLAVSKALAEKGANTILLCRDREKGESVIQDICRKIPGAPVELVICDLGSMQSIRQFVDEFKVTHSKLDILFNIAAVMKRKRTVTRDGFEMMFQVNYLAPFIFMNAFVGLLQNSASSQVINITRPAYKLRVNVDDLQFVHHYSMYEDFFITKLYLLFASLEYSRRHGKDGIATLMVDPGLFKSRLVREVPLFGWIKNLLSAPVTHAADNILHHISSEASASDLIKYNNGKVFKEKQEWPLSEYWEDTKTREHLWSLTESLVNDNYKR
jgi:NAD(P)-dependent dehydrogenase (short-subunit alcohol dehydrogenase family)